MRRQRAKQSCLLALAFLLLGPRPSTLAQAGTDTANGGRDGRHDFEIGAWKAHLESPGDARDSANSMIFYF